MIATVKQSTTATKTAILHALRAFIAQRSGIEFANYQSGDWKASRAAFMGDYRPILKHGRHARELLRAVELRDSITADDIIEASRHAFSGRLTIKVREDGAVAIDYCAGQYFPTEYRNAACAVLASTLWSYWRANMPTPTTGRDGSQLYDGMSAGDWLRRKARQEFGRGIAAQWFN